MVHKAVRGCYNISKLLAGLISNAIGVSVQVQQVHEFIEKPLIAGRHCELVDIGRYCVGNVMGLGIVVLEKKISLEKINGK